MIKNALQLFRTIGISILALSFCIGPAPVLAAEPLSALSSVIANPIFSSCLLANCNVNAGEFPQVTSISYTWQFSQPYDFTGSACQTHQIGELGCLKMIIKTNDTSLTNPDRFESWVYFWPSSTSTDITWNGPAGSYIYSVVPTDENSDNYNAYETLTVTIGCNSDCVFATGTTYSIDMVNMPLVTPYNASPSGYEQFPESVTFQAINPEVPMDDQAGQTVNNYGSGLNVTANIDARVGFNFQGKDAIDDGFYTEGVGSTFVTSTDSGCEFGTLSPGVPKVCLFDLNISTNAPNGYKIYVVQDQDMTFNGNTFKQFKNGTRTDESAAALWSSPSLATGGHLGYSSNDLSVFVADSSAKWAGIPTKVASNVAASSPAGLVADDTAPGDATYIYALKIEAATTQPQAPESLNQSYSHNEYFIVVGQF